MNTATKIPVHVLTGPHTPFLWVYIRVCLQGATLSDEVMFPTKIDPQWAKPGDHRLHCIHSNPWILADYTVALSLKRIRIIHPSLQISIN